ncbi:MAG: MarR family transcriptional regulator [Solirubrobacterales bacterium]|nr:MarR family transcriptional regulator [Solirubrobacterales bacterium]
MSPLTVTELAAWTGFLRLHQRLARELDAELEQAHGLSLGDYDVLTQLESADGHRLRMADLADAVLLTRSGLTRLVDRLQHRGLVERVKCSSDQRGMHAQLTEEGLARLHAARPTHLAGVRRGFLDELSQDETRALADLWARLGA